MNCGVTLKICRPLPNLIRLAAWRRHTYRLKRAPMTMQLNESWPMAERK